MQRTSLAGVVLLLVLSASILFAPRSASAQEETGETDAAQDEQLREGATVYSQVCASCHQSGGVGISGTFPPLLDNPSVDDTEYLTMVINEGLRGEIEVNGTTYDGVMPPFSTLSDEDTAALIAFIQNDFVAPVAAASTAPTSTGPAAGTELPGFTNIAKWLAYLVGIAAAALVLSPRVIGVGDRLNMPWLDAWLKTVVIVVAVVVLVVIVPDRIVRSGPVAELDRFLQDLIGVGAWLAGLSIVLGGLWYAHRESRV